MTASCALCEGACPECGGFVGQAAGNLDWLLCSMCHATFRHDHLREVPLAGGNLSGAVRIGETVRRPMGPWSDAVHALLLHLDGFDGAPRFLGVDDQGREVLEYIDGDVPWGTEHHRLLGSLDDVARVGGLLRAFHDAVASFEAPDGAVWRFPEMAGDAAAWTDERGTIVCHNDATAWNLVIGGRWAFIDWDVAGPRPFIWDVAYCAIGVLPIAPDTTGLGWPVDDLPLRDRLDALCDGYGLSAADRARLPEAITSRIASSLRHMEIRANDGIEPWPQMWADGHGRAWTEMLGLARASEASLR